MAPRKRLTYERLSVTCKCVAFADSRQFGAIMTGADLNNFDDEVFEKLREAVYTYSVVIIKGQQDLLPSKQFDFVHRFDPDANPTHGFGYGKSTKELGNLGV
jgi:hypothetical protein